MGRGFIPSNPLMTYILIRRNITGPAKSSRPRRRDEVATRTTWAEQMVDRAARGTSACRTADRGRVFAG